MFNLRNSVQAQITVALDNISSRLEAIEKTMISISYIVESIISIENFIKRKLLEFNALDSKLKSVMDTLNSWDNENLLRNKLKYLCQERKNELRKKESKYVDILGTPVIVPKTFTIKGTEGNRIGYLCKACGRAYQIDNDVIEWDNSGISSNGICKCRHSVIGIYLREDTNNEKARMGKQTKYGRWGYGKSQQKSSTKRK